MCTCVSAILLSCADVNWSLSYNVWECPTLLPLASKGSKLINDVGTFWAVLILGISRFFISIIPCWLLSSLIFFGFVVDCEAVTPIFALFIAI